MRKQKNKKKNKSLRTRIFTLMSILVAAQSIALVISLFVSQVFVELNSEALRLFENTAHTRAEKFNESTKLLIGSTSITATKLASHIEELSKENLYNAQNFTMADTLYDEVALASTEAITSFLRNNDVTGSFVVFKASNANKNDEKRHSAVYIRNASPEILVDTNENLQLEIGPAVLSKKHGIHIGPNWDIDMEILKPDTQFNYYTKPLLANNMHKNSEIERYGYWSSPIAILGKDRDDVITYTLPLLDKNGNSFGIFGFEISLSHITRNYLPSGELPYHNSFFALTPAESSSKINLSWFVPSSPLAQVHLEQMKELPLRNVSSYNFYESKIPELGDMYTIVSPLRLYSNNSPFLDDGWNLTTFALQSELHRGSAGVRHLLFTSIITVTILAFAAVFILTYFATRQLSQLPKDIRQFNPYNEVSFKKSGFREIDDLTAAVEMLNENIISSSEVTSKILELTEMPLGGFEVIKDSNYIVATDYIRQLMKKERDDSITKTEWEGFYNTLIAAPSEGENVYESQTEDGTRWFRIQHSETPSGYVGAILNVTDNVQKSRQLEKELYYDNLTRLYNRVAFKREVYDKLKEQPDKIGAMLFADLDNLKYINDNYGHDVGDQLLKKAGDMFSQYNKHGGIVSRISGDEFAIYLHGYSSKEHIRNIINRSVSRNHRFYIVTPDGATQQVRCSGGIAWYPDDSKNVTDLLKLSDYAMYEAKNQNKGTIFEFNRESYRRNIYLLENREAINQLLDEELIEFAFQPIVSLKTGETYGYEALMRPTHENFGTPLEVLAVASAQSKLAHLESIVVRNSYRYIAEHIDELGEKKVFINSVSDQLLTTEDRDYITNNFSHIFDRIVTEITEEKNLPLMLLQDKITGIRQRASMIAIDDYGAGYANEARILALAPDMIKIDLTIIQGVSKNPDKHKLVSNITSFCKQKGILTVAEGIETLDDLNTIMDIGIDFAQGFLLGEPKLRFKEVDIEVSNYIKSRYHIEQKSKK